MTISIDPYVLVLYAPCTKYASLRVVWLVVRLFARVCHKQVFYWSGWTL